MKIWQRVAIVGVGLIGGSLGLALRERRLAREVVGIGRRVASLRKAKRRGACSTTTIDLARGVAEADLIVVCTPVERVVEHAVAAAETCPDGAVITDVGSTKANIVAELDRQFVRYQPRDVSFVGGHPLAGSEKNGPEHARSDLFQDRAVVVTPSRRTNAAACDQVEQLWCSVGARVYRKSPAAHDRAVAAISHLPHVVASALAAATAKADLPLVAGGWLDTTRVAAADPELWRQILVDNRTDVLKAIDQFETVLHSLSEALGTDDQKRLIELLEAGRRNREAVGN